ncbi:MAG: hypothetical protein KGI37_03915 [Alphaproteobacteria bacterium]|nr:hypothetical protein [Alphaproteobacteria bacterium]
MRNKIAFAASLAALASGLAFASIPAFAGNEGVVTTAAPATAVTVRGGAHKDFDRVVFDWPRRIHYHLQHDNAQASVTFDAAGQMRFTPFLQSHLTRARDFAAHTDADGHVVVSFAVAPEARLTDFTSGNSVVVDIAGATAPATTTKTTPQPAAIKAPAPRISTPPPAPEKPASAKTPLVKTPPVKTPVPPQPAASPAATPAAAPATPAPATEAASFLPAVKETPTLIAVFDPRIATRAVIYNRADYGYIIFERKLALSVSDLTGGSAAHIDLQPLDLPDNTGYRFPLPPDTALTATRDGTAWKLFVATPQPELPVTTDLIAQPDFALGARLLLPLPDPPAPIHMVDPVVGDNLLLIPLSESEAFNVGRHMADFNILPAAQGLVIKPLTDKVVARDVSDGVEITAEGGLMLSPSSDTGSARQSASKAKAAAAGKSIFDFATWAGNPGESFTQTRQRLQQTIVDVPAIERSRATLELARFYFAHGNGAEAIGLLNMLADEIPDLRAHADFLALLGAADIVANRPEEGLSELASPLLQGQQEIELWQAIGLAQERKWPDAEEKFAITEPILAGYPEPFFSRYMVLAIETALAAGKDHEAADWLNFLTNAPHSDAIAPALNYLQGVIEAKAGQASAAEQSWKAAAASRDQLYQVRAELALVDLGVSTGSLTPAQAADRLEAMRFAWRGDDLEVDILHRLGDFYIEAKDVKDGLNTLAQAVALYPESPLTPQIHAEMAKIFHDVFLGKLGKNLSPLDALTLYQEYRDLMPTGKDGDAIMRNLADRLVAVDLLDQAASILEDLAKNHLQGADKDHVALHLAGIRLLDHKPADALSALDLLGNDVLTPAQQSERDLLRARALMELNRAPDALALLKGNTSQGAEMLRVDIAMRTQQWGDAATALMTLIGPPPPPGKSLTQDQANWLVNAAIAYSLGQDQAGLDKLAIDYSAAMASTPQNATFNMLTQPDKTGELQNLAAAQAQISQVDLFQSFLNSYRTMSDDATPPATTPAKK